MIKSLFSFLLLGAVLMHTSFAADEDYKPGPEAMVKEGVPRGKVTQHKWTSRILALFQFCRTL